MKKLVAYFSCSGTTRRAAEKLADAAKADLCEISPAVPYTSADLDWMDKKSRSSIECNDPKSRPAIASIPDIADYDIVFIGFPIWWYKEPNIIDTFLESTDLSGKTVIPFATSGGSGMGKTAAHMRSVCPKADVKNGFMLNDASASHIEKELSKL